jgi:hypothetical protein
MSIKSIPLMIAAIGSGDTTIATTDAATTKEFYTLTIHNTSASTAITVELFISADGTSAAGERIAYFSLDGKQSAKSTISLPASYYFLAKASNTGLNISGMYIQRTGTDAA